MLWPITWETQSFGSPILWAKLRQVNALRATLTFQASLDSGHRAYATATHFLPTMGTSNDDAPQLLLREATSSLCDNISYVAPHLLVTGGIHARSAQSSVYGFDGVFAATLWRSCAVPIPHQVFDEACQREARRFRCHHAKSARHLCAGVQRRSRQQGSLLLRA